MHGQRTSGSNHGKSARGVMPGLWERQGRSEKLSWREEGLLVWVTESCPTLCDPMDYSPPGSSVHGILQARILEWVVGSHSLLQGIFPIQGSNPGLLHWRVGSLSSEPPAKRYSRPRTNERTACAESKDKSTWCSPAGLEHSVGEEQHRWAEDLAGLRSCSVFKPTPWHAEEQ